MAIKDWKVLGNRLLLRRIELPNMGSIIRPESADEEREIHTQECEIVMVGELALGHGFTEGQRVIVLENWAKVEIEGEVLVVVDADDDALLSKPFPAQIETECRLGELQGQYVDAMTRLPEVR